MKALILHSPPLNLPTPESPALCVCGHWRGWRGWKCFSEALVHPVRCVGQDVDGLSCMLDAEPSALGTAGSKIWSTVLKKPPVQDCREEIYVFTTYQCFLKKSRMPFPLLC